MIPGQQDLRLESRASLVADICEHLRAGRDPRDHMRFQLAARKADPEDREFVNSIISVLQPEPELSWS